MLTIKIPMLSNFSLGQLVCTNGVNKKIEQDNEFKKFVEESLARYTNSDWGDACNEDVKMNNDAIRNGDRILAVYTQKNTDVTIWIITECDRSVTTILFPNEY